MNSSENPNYHLEVIEGNDLSAEQEEFINYWNQHYFGEIAVAKGLAKAPVHWRLILSEDRNLLSHVALTGMKIELNVERIKVGAVGGLFTPPELQGRGHATALMDHAEDFLFDRLELPACILFCLPELVPFYTRRGWSLVEGPVTLQQKTGVVTWGAAAMLLNANQGQSVNHTIHVPMK